MTPTWLGRYPLGKEIPLVLRCTIAGVPDRPSSHPTAEIRGDSSNAVYYHRRVAADGQGVLVGLFRQPLLLGGPAPHWRAAPAVGRYTVTFRWTDSASVARVEIQQFEAVGGGSADGAVIAMRPVDGPDARWLLTQSDAGVLKANKNPR